MRLHERGLGVPCDGIYRQLHLSTYRAGALPRADTIHSDTLLPRCTPGTCHKTSEPKLRCLVQERPRLVKVGGDAALDDDAPISTGPLWVETDIMLGQFKRVDGSDKVQIQHRQSRLAGLGNRVCDAYSQPRRGHAREHCVKGRNQTGSRPSRAKISSGPATPALTMTISTLFAGDLATACLNKFTWSSQEFASILMNCALLATCSQQI